MPKIIHKDTENYFFHIQYRRLMFLNVLSYSGYGIDWMCHLNIEIFYGTIAMFIVVLVTILFHKPKKVSLFPLLILIVSSNIRYYARPNINGSFISS